MFNYCITLHFFIQFFYSPLFRAVIGNEPQRRYYWYSLDHNDKTWTSDGSMGATPPLARRQ